MSSIDRIKVLFVHGAGGGGWEWNTWLPAFSSDQYETFAIDLLPSPSGLESTDFKYYEDILNTIDRRPDVLIGASMGGLLCLRAFTAMSPKALVIVCSAIPLEVLELIDEASKPVPIEYPAVIQWANGAFEDTVNCLPDADEDMHKFAWQRWRDESGLVLNEIQHGLSIPHITCPVLCLIPDDDESIDPHHQKLLANYIHAETIHLADMKHVSPLLGRNSVNVANQVLSWLKRNGL